MLKNYFEGRNRIEKCIRSWNVSRSTVWKNRRVYPSLVVVYARLLIQYGAGNCKKVYYRRMDAESFNLNLVKQKWNKMEIINLGSPHLEQVLQYDWIPLKVSSALVISSIWRKNRTDPALHRCSFPMLSSHNTSYVTDLKSRKNSLASKPRFDVPFKKQRSLDIRKNA